VCFIQYTGLVQNLKVRVKHGVVEGKRRCSKNTQLVKRGGTTVLSRSLISSKAKLQSGTKKEHTITNNNPYKILQTTTTKGSTQNNVSERYQGHGKLGGGSGVRGKWLDLVLSV